ncbi:MAG: ExbD/TolR family protein [Opitutaceae bacterium]
MPTRRLFNEEAAAADINISPLIDMVFILLIFFIVTTAFVEEEGLAFGKPASVSAGRQDEKNTILLTLTSGGQVRFHGRTLGAGDVSAAVRGRLQQDPAPVIIHVQEGVIAGFVVRVIDEAKLAGAERISLTTP